MARKKKDLRSQVEALEGLVALSPDEAARANGGAKLRRGTGALVARGTGRLVAPLATGAIRARRGSGALLARPTRKFA